MRLTIRFSMLIVLLIMMTVALSEPVRVVEAQHQDPSCVQECNEASRFCAERAREEYIRCGQQGGTAEQCATVRNNKFSQCMRDKGCQRCQLGDWWSIGPSVFCRCAGIQPTGGGGVRGGSGIEPYDYSDPFDIGEDEDFSWYCEYNPCACDNSLPWCGSQ